MNIASKTSTGTRARLIVSLLIIDELAYISYGYSTYEYVGDPINILNILSGFEVDEVLIIDLSASRANHLNLNLMRRLRAVSDFPLSYAGGIRTMNDANAIMQLGFDKLCLNACNPNLSILLLQISQYYGVQSLAVSVDYTTVCNKRYIYNPYTRNGTQLGLATAVCALPVNLFSDILFSSVPRAGSQTGIDIDIIYDTTIQNLRNPIVLSSGLGSNGRELLAQLTELHSGVAGLAASASIFLQSVRFSALVCLERHY